MVKLSRASGTPLQVTLDFAPTEGMQSVAFDDRGMPHTVTAARAMPAAAIKSALIASIAKLQRRTTAQYTAASVPASDGSPSFDSMEVIWLIAEFSKPFDGPVVDVSKVVDRAKWSSADALAALLLEGMK